MEGASGHQGRCKKFSAIKRRIMAMKNNGRDHNDQKKNNNGRK